MEQRTTSQVNGRLMFQGFYGVENAFNFYLKEVHCAATMHHKTELRISLSHFIGSNPKPMHHLLDSQL